MPEDLVLSRLSALEAELAETRARLAGMDKAVSLLEKFPTAIDIAVGNLKQLHDEKFRNVQVRFDELNTRLTEGDRYKQTALDAAMRAAEERSQKTEQLFTKQIENVTKTADDLQKMVRENAGGWKAILAAATLFIAVLAIAVEFLRH
jgi:hypothetical protein